MREWIFAALFVVAAFATMVLVPAADARADSEYQRVDARADFLALVQDRDLTRLGITLDVRPEGSIGGSAFGAQVTGDWTWEDGFFCRTIYYGRQTLERNCQEVKHRGDIVRFTADRGAGDTADLRLRD